MHKPAGSARAKGKGAASAATSDTSSTVADQDLKRAKAHIENLNRQIRELGKSRDAEHLKYAKATELANTQLNLQAKTINEMISSNAKALRSSQIETAKAIAKINSIRGHAEGFAENMLHKAADGQAPDLVTTWAAFSGVLTSETIDAADWGATKKKVPGTHSKNVFDITEFLGQESASPPTPMQHVVYQLTDAKVHAQPTPEGYQPPVPPAPLLLQWATGGAGKRKRDDSGDDDSSDNAEDEDEDDGIGLGLGTGLRSPFRASCGRSSPPPMCPHPPRCRPHCLAHPKRAEWLACTGRVSLAVSNRLA